MAVKIFNEGRVVGYSAYEVYVKQHMAANPKDASGDPIPPASERQWLASSLAMGSSMILRVPYTPSSITDEDVHHYVDIELPDNSMLGAANTIMASFFDGEIAYTAASVNPSTFTNGGWATKVTDYGSLIANNSTASPLSDLSSATGYPTQIVGNWSQTKKNRLKDYMKIVDGVVLQPGTWTTTGTTPTKDMIPSLSGRACVRLHIKGTITNPVYVLLTGLTVKYVLSGVSGLDGSVNTTSNPLKTQDGDFLGPAVWPWANKIIFTVPNSYIAFFESGAYKRQLPADSSSLSVKDTAVIDMKSPSQSAGTSTAILQPPVLENYYNTGITETDQLFYPYTSGHASTTAAQALAQKKAARVTDNVSDYSTLGDGTAVITVYQKKSVYPPALYGTFVDSTGTEYLHAIDSVAPGSIKMFTGDPTTVQATMIDYQNTFPGTTAMCKDDDGAIYVVNKSDEVVPVVKVDLANIAISGSGSTTIQKATIKSGKNTAILMSLQKANQSTQVTITTTPSTSLTTNNTLYNNKISWYGLIRALEEDKSIDLLESRLANAKSTLIKTESAGSSAPYLEFGPENAKRRLYISAVAPETTDVPIGSIGIGWGFDSASGS